MKNESFGLGLRVQDGKKDIRMEDNQIEVKKSALNVYIHETPLTALIDSLDCGQTVHIQMH